MATSVTRSSSSKHSRSPTSTAASSSHSSSKSGSSAVSSHLAMVELKSRILSALAKLSDRDTHQVAADDLDRIIAALPPEGVPMFINSLLQDPAPPSLVARRESLRLLALLCASHPDPAAANLPKIIAYIVRRLKDPASDSSVRDACRDAAGSLSSLFIRPSDDGSSTLVALFVKPLFETMAEQNKAVQAGAAMCLAKVVECAGGGGPRPASAPGSAFQKLCPRICKLLGGQSFLAKAALLSVISSLSQVGAISTQGMLPLLHSIRECLDSSDWATRKAAADTLVVLASHSSNLIADGAPTMITALEACRFDKVKPVRDSMMEALVLWKKISGNGEDGTTEDLKDGKKSDLIDNQEKSDQQRSNASNRLREAIKDSLSVSAPTINDAISRGKGGNILEKAAVILKKKAPSLTDKELNPEFFQKLETRSSDDLPVEVVLPRRCLQSSHSQGEEPDLTGGNSRSPSNHNGGACQESNDYTNNYQGADKRHGAYPKLHDSEDTAREKWTEQRGVRGKDLKARALDVEDRFDINQKVLSADRAHITRTEGHADGSFLNNKGHWLAIHKQLSQLERQQTNLMNMLQGFMGGSHDSMVTLENRVRGLERVVEEMARDLALSTGKRGGNMMMGYEGSPGRSSSKYNGLNEFPGAIFGRGNDSRFPFAERFLLSDTIASGVRGRDPPWRPDSDSWESYAYSAPRNGIGNSRKFGSASMDGRLQRPDHDGDQPGSRRAWDKGQGPFRLGEGPSARSVWQASKDEATLEAIRIAGEDNGTSLSAQRGAIRELDAEALVDDNRGNDKGLVWEAWTRAMDSLHIGDMDSAYAEVLSTGDDLLLVKLMDRSGPVMDQLSAEIACEVLRAVGQFLLEQSLLDVALPWTQQLIDLVEENGADFLGIPLEGKKDILLNLREASAMEPPEDWEGVPSEELLMHPLRPLRCKNPQAMETPSSIRRVTRSQASAVASQKVKQDDSFLKQRNGDRVPLFDVSNDSPIVGLAASSGIDKTPSSKNRVRGKEAPGSGESLLRGQVKNLLQMVEEEVATVVIKPPVWVTIADPVYPGHLLAPTPANTPQIASVTVKEPEQEEVIRALLFDSPGKSEKSDCSEASYQLSIRSCGEKSIGDDNSSTWSLQVNTSIKEDEEEEGDVYYNAEDDQEGEEDEECYDDLCDILTKMSVEDKVRLPEFAGKHTRFVYNEDGEIEGEEEVGEGRRDENDKVLVLKGLPVPEGKHVRFQEEED